MIQHQFVPPSGAFTRSVPVRFSHCDPAGIVYFPHYFDMFNGLIEDWYTQELGYDYADLIMGSQYGFPFVHIECDFKVPSRMGDIINLTLLVDGDHSRRPPDRIPVQSQGRVDAALRRERQCCRARPQRDGADRGDH